MLRCGLHAVLLLRCCTTVHWCAAGLLGSWGVPQALCWRHETVEDPDGAEILRWLVVLHH